MTDAKFQQLVSLYLDGEITPAEEALLAREIRDNPDRRTAFLRYKQLQVAAAKACREHQEVFVGYASTGNGRRVTVASVSLMGGALAACVALAAFYLKSSAPDIHHASAPVEGDVPIAVLPPTAVAFRSVVPVQATEEPLLHRTWEEAQIGLLRNLRYEAVVYGNMAPIHEPGSTYSSVFESGASHGGRQNGAFVISQGTHWNSYR